MKYYIGIDVGGTAIKTGIVNMDGEIIKNYSFDGFFDNYETPLWQTTLKAVEETVKQCKLLGHKIEGIGFSITGDIDINKNIIVGGCGTIPLWSNVDIQGDVDKCLGEHYKITSVNDANSAAIAEHWIGNAKGHDNVIVYTIGTGIGGGIFVNGKLLEGANGFAGNIGHMVIADGEDVCACGNRGCFERMASTRNLIRKFKEVGIEDDLRVLFSIYNGECKEGIDVDMVRKVIDEFFDLHGVAVGSLIHIFNPSAVVIGGGISGQGQWFIDKIAEHVKTHTLKHFSKDVVFMQAQLTNNAGIVGAVKNFIDKTEV